MQQDKNISFHSCGLVACAKHTFSVIATYFTPAASPSRETPAMSPAARRRRRRRRSNIGRDDRSLGVRTPPLSARSSAAADTILILEWRGRWAPPRAAPPAVPAS